MTVSTGDCIWQRDKIGQRQILARLTRLPLGNWDDCKPVGGGDKSTQQRDIAKARTPEQPAKTKLLALMCCKGLFQV
ncbi:MAG: hypothetical protein KBT18_07000 [Comamonas sp.]|nr:hypothetical protein [Candidatus Comamonas equi]